MQNLSACWLNLLRLIDLRYSSTVLRCTERSFTVLQILVARSNAVKLDVNSSVMFRCSIIDYFFALLFALWWLLSLLLISHNDYARTELILFQFYRTRNIFIAGHSFLSWGDSDNFIAYTLWNIQRCHMLLELFEFCQCEMPALFCETSSCESVISLLRGFYLHNVSGSWM